MALQLRVGQVVLLAQSESLPPRKATIASAGPHTVRYRDEAGVLRSLKRRTFIARIYKARGAEPPVRKGNPARSLHAVSTPTGGQPGFRR